MDQLVTLFSLPPLQITSNEKHLESLRNAGSLLRVLEQLAAAERYVGPRRSRAACSGLADALHRPSPVISSYAKSQHLPACPCPLRHFSVGRGSVPSTCWESSL